MATEDIAFNLDVNTNGGAKSLSDLKKEFKELQKELSNTKEGTKEYQLALQKLGAVKDDIGDLRDTIGALNPEGKIAAFAKVGSTIASGFAAAQGAAALFGAESEELQKTMLKVQAAMALAEGIKGITAAGDAFKVLNVVMKANPILAIVAAFTALTAAVGYLYNEYFRAETQAQKLEKAHNNLIETNKALTKQIQRDIEILEAQGASHDKVLSKKKELMELQIKEAELNIELRKEKIKEVLANDDINDSILRVYESTLKKMGLDSAADKIAAEIAENKKERMQEDVDSLKASLESIENAKHTFNVAEVKDDKLKHDELLKNQHEANEKHKKLLDERAADEKKHLDDLYQQHLNDVARFEQARKDQAELDKVALAEEDAALKEDQLLSEQEYQESSMAIEAKANSDKEFAEAESLARRKEGYKQLQGSQLELTKQTLQSAQALTDLYFGHQLKMAKGNADKEKEIKKKQFNVNKAFGVANSIIDGVGAIQKALNNPYPLNIILAVLTGVLATANTIKIASSKFDDGGSAGGGGDVGSLGGTASAPVIPQPNNTVTQINDNGQVSSAKPKQQEVVIYEGKMTDTQKRSVNIEESAKIG